MKYEVIISDEAARLIEEHVLFVAEVSIEAAIELKESLMTAIRSLYDLPERHPFLSDNYLPANKYHKMVVSKRYIILYQIRDMYVYVDHVLDCRQDYRWLIKGTK